jgi:hypothetical protein
MKKLVATVSIAAGLAAAIASPALAKSTTLRHVARAPHAASSPYRAYGAAPYGAYAAAPYGAYAAAPYGAYAAAPYGAYRPVRPGSSRSVYDIRGNWIGADPDPTVRNQLARDPTQGD